MLSLGMELTAMVAPEECWKGDSILYTHLYMFNCTYYRSQKLKTKKSIVSNSNPPKSFSP